MNNVAEDIQMLVVAILAWIVENDEPFNVSTQTVDTIVRSMVANNTLPEILWDDSTSGLLKIGVRLVNEDGKVPTLENENE